MEDSQDINITQKEDVPTQNSTQMIKAKVGPLPKQITTLDGLIRQEPGFASIRDDVPIRQVARKNRLKGSNNDFGHIRIHIPAHKSKIDLIRSTLLSRHLKIEDIQDPFPIIVCRNITWNLISEPEAFNATSQVPFTTPVTDEITFQVIRSAWPILGKRINNLSDCCIKFGFLPKVFKQADFIILPKSGSRDRTFPTPYRPITLISCLGKELKRLIARRISYCVLKRKIFAQNYCSAIRRRPAVNLTTALVYDIKIAL
ncbi:hypothetical protein EPUL_005058 [Erysiphe pulchra]|uniref:Reverse transcriptase domain-containing protein n=1 Tax=Erysiphe pulchra TaxID=225359 RepID=A0A2S4PYP1_9PEZI|nr:hypothetical protein EPUL_005058 [Erysiphe pulchra]